MIKVAILTVSDKGSTGDRKDKSGRVIADFIEDFGGREEFYDIIPDEKDLIEKTMIEICERDIDLLLTTGGTGFAARDVTPEATLAVIEREAPGLVEKIRHDTMKITPMASLSRARAGIRKSTLIINLPGSPKAVRECLEAVSEVIPHGIEILRGEFTEHN